MNKIIFCAWGITPEQQKVLESLKKYTLKKLKEFNLDYEVDIQDPKLYEECTFSSPIILFGNHKLSNVYIDALVRQEHVAPLKELTSGDNIVAKKKEVAKRIDVLVEELANPLPVPEPVVPEPIMAAVIEQQGIKFGSLFGDILITEQEANHLKKIKDILGGGKMVITKGDLKVEVE